MRNANLQIYKSTYLHIDKSTHLQIYTSTYLQMTPAKHPNSETGRAKERGGAGLSGRGGAQTMQDARFHVRGETRGIAHKRYQTVPFMCNLVVPFTCDLFPATNLFLLDRAHLRPDAQASRVRSVGP